MQDVQSARGIEWEGDIILRFGRSLSLPVRSFARGHADAFARSASEEMSESELQQAIDRAIASLPEAQRSAVILRRYEDMPYEEIAKVLRTTVPAVKSLLFRARGDLKDRLKGFL